MPDACRFGGALHCGTHLKVGAKVGRRRMTPMELIAIAGIGVGLFPGLLLGWVLRAAKAHDDQLRRDKQYEQAFAESRAEHVCQRGTVYRSEYVW